MKLAIVLGALALSASLVRADVHEQKTDQKSFSLASGPRKLIVDNVFGRVNVVGYSGNTVDVTVHEDWNAESADRMTDAHREVRLDMTTEGNTVKLYVDGPFRCRNGCSDHWDRGYHVRFDFDVRVPQDADLELRTVNNGGIRVENTNGNFRVSNVNAAIDMKNVGGSGTVTTVNGGIKVGFASVPKEACSFRTVNGGVEVEYPSSFGADVEFKTLNGSLYTDFDATALASVSEQGTREGTKFVYRRGSATRLRLGNGGPQHRYETVNGDITIGKNKS